MPIKKFIVPLWTSASFRKVDTELAVEVITDIIEDFEKELDN